MAVRAWIGAQNERCEGFLGDAPGRVTAFAFLTRIWDHAEETVPAHYGGRYFSFLRNGLAPQQVFQVRDTADGPPRILIDPNLLSGDGLVALGSAKPSRDGRLVAYTVSVAGGDEVTMHIRDVETGIDLPDRLPGLRFTDAAWDDDGKGFYYSRPADDGSGRLVALHHKIGDDPAKNRIVCESPLPQSLVRVAPLKNSDLEYAVVAIGTLPQTGLQLRQRGSDGSFREIFPPGRAVFNPVAAVDDRIYMVTDAGAPHGQLVSFTAGRPDDWHVVLPESQDILIAVEIKNRHIIAFYRHDCADRIKIFGVDGRFHHELSLPVQSTATIGRFEDGDETILLKISDFLQPGIDYRYDPVTNRLTPWRGHGAVETLEGCIVERISALSKDRTPIPMTVIRHPDTKLDGSAAVRVYGYGGFNASLEPAYSRAVVHWVRAGGIFVQANLRGGGEFGIAWYDQGRLLKKQNVFDDFAACADALIARSYTCAARLAIEGRSNGGLLTAATRLQYPEKFGAVLCAVPVTDMLLFARYSYGAYWKSDYGDPEHSRADFDNAMRYSPQHCVKAGGIYPPMLVLTADHDERVMPGPHAYKYVATEQSLTDPQTLCLLRVDVDAGHGVGKPAAKIIQELADCYAFLEIVLGPIDQKTYNASRP